MTDVKENIAIKHPFPGFRAFGPKESHLFFGREKQVTELLRKLRANKLLAIVGTSGSGKSSLINCGLIPRMKAGFSAQAGDEWCIATMQTGRDPVGNLALALANVLHDQERIEPNYPSHIEKILRSGSLGLSKAYRQSAINGKANLMLVIDQFEEIFRYNEAEKKKASSRNDSMAFINLLLYALRQKDPIYIVLAMRSDYLGNCAEFRGLPEEINEGQYLIPRMKRLELRRAIIGPLALVGVKASTELQGLVLDEVKDGTDQLPLFQHALMRTLYNWRQKEDRTPEIEIIDYEEIGRIEEALNRHAEEAFADLRSLEQERLCKRIFQALTEKGSENIGIGRSLPIRELSNLTGVTTREVINVVKIFAYEGRSLLEVPDAEDIDYDTVVSLSHDSLIREWDRLTSWVEEEAISVDIYHRLTDAAVRGANLWRDPELQIGLRWLETAKPDDFWASRYNDDFKIAHDFLLRSQKDYEAKLAREEQERKQKLARARWFARVAGLVVVLMVIFTAFSLYLTKKASDAKIEANAQEEIATEQKYKAVISAEEANFQKIKAEKSEVKAIKEQERAERSTIEAKANLIIANQQTKIAKENEAKAESERKRAEKNRQKAITEAEKAEKARREAMESEARAVKSANTARELQRIALAQSVAAKSLQVEDPSLKSLLAKEAFEINRVYNGDKFDPYIYESLYWANKNLYGENFNTFNSNRQQGHRGPVWGLKTSRNGKKIYTVGSDGRICFWNADKPRNLPMVLGNTRYLYRTMGISPGEKWLVSGGEIVFLEIYNLKNFEETPKRIIAHGGKGIKDIAMFSDKAFFTAGNDKTIGFCNMDTVTTFVQANATVNSLSLNRAGTKLAAGDQAGFLRIYDLSSGKVLMERKESIEITAVEFSPDGQKVAIGTAAGKLVIWDINTKIGKGFEGHSSRISQISFNADGTKLVTGSYDRTARIWVVDHLGKSTYLPMVLRDHDSWVMSVAFDNRGTEKVITGTRLGTLKHWNTDSQVLADKICPKLDRNLSTNEWKRFVGLDEMNDKAISEERKRTELRTCPGLKIGDEN